VKQNLDLYNMWSVVLGRFVELVKEQLWWTIGVIVMHNLVMSVSVITQDGKNEKTIRKIQQRSSWSDL